ncbi:hypothetical protein [Streptomyces sp. NPDC018045]|uniref:hypothetical protein n=1 Tax=Streptomyces sp. NPDC018045 TaxID=3365037 RepID=UPI00378B84E9
MVKGTFDSIAESFGEAAAKFLQVVTSSWLRLDGAQISDESGPIAFLLDNTRWLVAWMAVLSLLLASIRMAWQRKGQPAKEAFEGLVRLVVVTGMSVGVFNALVLAGDKFSIWIVNRSLQCGGGDGCGKEFGKMLLAATVANPQLGPAVIFCLGFLAILGSVIQIFLLLVQKATLPLLAGTMPLAAAASSTAAGRSWLQKSIGLSVALILYKPAAAIVYAAAFNQMVSGKSSGGQSADIMGALSGVMLLVLAAFTLPAMMRMVMPMAAAAAGGAGGAASLGTVGSSVAQGAVMVKSAGASKAAKGAGAAKGATQASGASPPNSGKVPAQGGHSSGKDGPGGAGASGSKQNGPGARDGGAPAAQQPAGGPQGAQQNGAQPGTGPQGAQPGTAQPGPQGGNSKGPSGSSATPAAGSAPHTEGGGPRGSR